MTRYLLVQWDNPGVWRTFIDEADCDNYLEQVDQGECDILKFDEVAGGKISRAIVISEEVEDDAEGSHIEFTLAHWEPIE